MDPIANYLRHHWLAITCLAAALGMAGWLVARVARKGHWPVGLLLSTASLLLFGLGGLGLIEPEGLTIDAAGFWLTLAPLVILAVLLAVALSTGNWSAPAGYFLGAVFLFGLGQGIAGGLQAYLTDGYKLLLTLDPLQPLWLLLLLLVPVIIWLSYRSLSGLGPVRRWVAIGLRCFVVALLLLALAETHARRADENLTVIFLWDRSLSIPPEYAQGDNRDLREERIRTFMNNAVLKRGAGKEEDKVGLIVFGRKPRLELPPASVPQLKFTKLVSRIDDTYTDLAASIKLGLASFPEGTSKRLVLISDGNENLGQAEEQARIAKENGVQIDVLPIAAGRRNPNEVLVERIEAPPFTEKDTRLPLRIVLRSFHPEIVVGDLKLTKTSLEMRKAPDEGEERPSFEKEPLVQKEVRLRHGLNVFYFQQPGAKQEDAYTFEAQFIPTRVEDARGKLVQFGLKGDRVENNQASTSVMARGQRAVLIVESTKPDREGDEPHTHKLLAERLQRARSSLKVLTIDAERLPQDPTQLAIILSKFDCVILANVPADALSEEQQKVLRSNTHDQGCGLIVVGGNRGFGAGGWQGTELEKAMPVTSDLKSLKVEGKSGLVMMMHASEMAEGNAWQRKIAKLAIDRLSSMDMVGMLYYDHGMVAPGGGHIWHIPFQEIGNQKRALMSLVDTMSPGDMPDVDPAFDKAYKQLTNPVYALGTKHIIFISDGDHWNASRAMLLKLRAAKITCTTVCITTHGKAEVDKMAAVAQFVGGRAYHITNPSELPAIYIRESRLVSQSFTHEKPFSPEIRFAGGPTEGLGKLEDLYGFVRTTKRPSPLVEAPIMTPKIGEAEFPILAYWQYGLGKSIAFTSDARTNPGGRAYWDKDWANSNTYSKFWEQTVDWSLRPTESGKFLHLTTEQRDGKVRVTIDAKDADKNPLTSVKFKTGITAPSFKGPDGPRVDLKFEQKNAGIYEADIPVDEAGNFFL
ncbi:MAG: VWA domain-containing protein, partial [Planctomycetes bacterium]|nr:VWA domain-containing protein [Planctomycetota bacterium]